MLTPVTPFDPRPLFPPLGTRLIEVLEALEPEGWLEETACTGWRVREVASHLLGGSIGRLAGERARLAETDPDFDAYAFLFELQAQLPQPSGSVDMFDRLVPYIDQLNAAWIELTRDLTPEEIQRWLALTDQRLADYFMTLDPDGMTPIGVLWAGETRSANWFDMAREYTEKWLHQQHIREGVGAPLLLERRWLHPVLATFVRALPVAYRLVRAEEGTAVTLHINGEGGGSWSLLRDTGLWWLYRGAAEAPAATITLDQDSAWRLFTGGLSAAEARRRVRLTGERRLGEPIFRAIAIMA